MKEGGAWWRAYESKDILDRFRGANHLNGRIAVTECVAWRNRLQVDKDSSSDYKLIPGRSNLQMPAST